MEICDALCDLVPFVQFKKREKQPWESVNFAHWSGVSTVDYENVNASWVYSYIDVDTSLIKYFILNNVFKMECGKTELVKMSTAVW